MKPRGGIVVASLVLPAGVLVVDAGGLSPYGPAKWWLVSTTAALAGALCLGGNRLRAPRPVCLTWAAFLGVLILGAALGADRLYAWTGTPERNFGVATWILCALMFLVGHTLDDAGDGRWVVAVAVATAGMAGAWTTAEALGWAPVAGVHDAVRLLGPLGSAAFLGAATALLLPVCVGVVIDGSWSARLRRLAGGCAAVCAVGLVGSGARAAWFGTTAAAVWVAGVHRRWLVAHARTALIALAIGAVALMALGTALGAQGRVSTTLDRSAGGGISRVDEWRVAVRVIALHPLGVGPEGYRIVFHEGVDASYERDYGRQALPDRAHNVLLDVALSGGFPGAALYVVLIGVVARSLLQAVRRGPAWTAGVAAGIAAYWTQEQLLFPVATLEPAVWLLIGLVVAQAAEPGSLSMVPGRRLAAGLSGALAAVALVAGARDVLADRQARAALVSLDRGAIGRGAHHATRAVSLRPDVVRYRLAAERAHAASGTVEGDAKAVADLHAALTLSPGDPVVRSTKAKFLLDRAQRSLTAADIAEAASYLRALVNQDGLNGELQLRVGVADDLAGDEAGAERAWRAADWLAPASASASTDLAKLYVRQGRWPEAQTAARRAAQRDPTSDLARQLEARIAEHGT